MILWEEEAALCPFGPICKSTTVALKSGNNPTKMGTLQNSNSFSGLVTARHVIIIAVVKNPVNDTGNPCVNSGFCCSCAAQSKRYHSDKTGLVSTVVCQWT